MDPGQQQQQLPETIVPIRVSEPGPDPPESGGTPQGKNRSQSAYPPVPKLPDLAAQLGAFIDSRKPEPKQ